VVEHGLFIAMAEMAVVARSGEIVRLRR